MLDGFLKTSYTGKETLQNNYTEVGRAVRYFTNNKSLDVKTPRPLVSLCRFLKL